MKWTDLTKASGDDGCSQFGSERLSKDDPIFEVLGELDMLNAMLGVCKQVNGLLLYSNRLQNFNRRMMGYWHSDGKYCSDVMENGLADLSRHLDLVCAKLDEIDSNGPLGWHDYDNEWFVACCQCRKVERLIREMQLRTGDPCWRKALPIFNRMSKILYCIGIYQSKINDNRNTRQSS